MPPAAATGVLIPSPRIVLRIRIASVRNELRKMTSGFFWRIGEITTEVRMFADAGPWYYAEAYHQQYLHKNPGGYCNHGFCQVAYDRQGFTGVTA